MMGCGVINGWVTFYAVAHGYTDSPCGHHILCRGEAIGVRACILGRRLLFISRASRRGGADGPIPSSFTRQLLRRVGLDVSGIAREALPRPTADPFKNV